MKIKQITTLLVLSLTLFLTACQDSVSNDEETIFGRFSVDPLEQKTADDLIRQAVEFDEDSLGKARFVDGYSVLNASAGSSLYLGIYKYESSINNSGIALQTWAQTLQDSNKYNWTFITQPKDELGNGQYGSYGETQYDTSNAFSINDQKNSTAAVLVEYKDGTFWVYLAMPMAMIKAKDDEQVIELFNKHRYSK